jgi:hypothetical protein
MSANPTEFSGPLNDGLSILSQAQTVTFSAYTRTVLPLDGYVFWVPLNESADIAGSLHFSQEIVQNTDETLGYATVTFTTQTPIALFTDAPIDTIYVASFEGMRFAFSQQQGLYSAAGPLYHYFGHSIQPAMASQLLDPPRTIDITQAVVSNSLPLWLALNNYSSPFDNGFTTAGVPFFVAPPTLYPADMVPANLEPPYGTVEIGENDTEALQAVPLIDVNRNHYQLCADWVTITLYGLQSNAAQDFRDTVDFYMTFTGNFGLMNTPVVRDAPRKQAELQTRAMKKTLRYRISYNQERVANVARKLILSCVPSYLIQS